jgi:hypothetical protein
MAVNGNGSRVAAENGDIGLTMLQQSSAETFPPLPRYNTLMAQSQFALDEEEGDDTGRSSPAAMSGEGEGCDEAEPAVIDLPAGRPTGWGQQLLSVISGTGGRVAAEGSDTDISLCDLSLDLAEDSEAAEDFTLPPPVIRYNTLVSRFPITQRAPQQRPGLRLGGDVSVEHEEPAILSRHDHRSTQA